MSSPFPGMDPYLEAHWGDVHTSLVTYTRDQLQDQLPGDLKVRVEEHVAVEEEGIGFQGFYPDIRVVERAGAAVADRPALKEVVADPAVLCPMDFEAPTQRSIRIIDSRSGNRVVTAIEILGRVNKVNEEGIKAYRAKQQTMLQGRVNLVEIDLLRTGNYVLAVPCDNVPEQLQGPYRICVVPASRQHEASVYRASFRRRLPRILIPLREGEQEVPLDLQLLVDQSYKNGGYEDIDYRRDPDPPLAPADAAWADELLRAAGRR